MYSVENGTFTYAEEVGNPAKLEKTGKLPLSHITCDILGLFDGHVLPSFRVIRIAVLHLYCIDASISKFVLEIFERDANGDYYGSKFDRLFNNGSLQGGEDGIYCFGIVNTKNQGGNDQGGLEFRGYRDWRILRSGVEG